jgi:hypothetical protein
MPLSCHPIILCLFTQNFVSFYSAHLRDSIALILVLIDEVSIELHTVYSASMKFVMVTCDPGTYPCTCDAGTGFFRGQGFL